MELNALVGVHHLLPDASVGEPESPGSKLGMLLHDLRTGEGFGWLLKGLLRTLGQDSTRFLLKRHGYALGVRAAEQALKVQSRPRAQRPGAALLDALGAHLQVGHVPHASVPLDEESIAWYCAVPASIPDHFETRINHENAFVSLVMGYATGYLNRSSERDFRVTYDRQLAHGGVSIMFVARGVASADEYDPDLMLHHCSFASPARDEATTQNAASPLLPRRRVLSDGAELTAVLKQVAATDATVLLLGESGVGKSVVAHELHALSLRAQRPWVEINCAAIPEQLFESELFGAERGAFSGAAVSRKGKFELAHGGTLFLDEVALLTPAAQSKLLRVLQTGEFERLGSNTTVRADVRLIAATNESLERLVQERRFREDLYWRLNVFPVHIPALRERRNEIPAIAAALIQQLSAKYRKNIPRCSAEAREILLAHDWPGNVRELENMLERAVILCPSGSEIQPAHLADLARKCPSAGMFAHPSRGEGTGSSTLVAVLDAAPHAVSTRLDQWAEHAIEQRLGSLHGAKDALLRAAYRRSNGNIALAADALGLTRSQMTYQLRKIGTQPAEPHSS
jgi:two-component system, NtrC family, response regulator HydG